MWQCVLIRQRWCFLSYYLSGPVHWNLFSIANNQLSHVLSCNESLLTFRVVTICSPAKLIFIIVLLGLSHLGEIHWQMLTVCQIKHSAVPWVTSQECLHVGFECCTSIWSWSRAWHMECWVALTGILRG